MQDRIAQLERLVLSMRPDTTPKTGFDDSTYGSTYHTPIDAVNSPGQISLSEHQYVGDDHWVAIMDSIADLKPQCDWQASQQSPSDEDVQADEPDAQLPLENHALLLFGSQPPSSRAALIAALPRKNVVDRYISRYFNFQDLVSCQ